MKNISITDEDISSISDYFKCDFSDENRTKALRSTESIDVQACPGSGKTTLLVAKLAILSSKWMWKDRGICVLSHTNVAREEVQKQLYNHPTGYNLLNYPHFIGTIQSFVDYFLAIPFIRHCGADIVAIDNDRFAGKAFGLSGRYQKIRAFRSFHPYDAPIVISTLKFEGPNLILGCDSDKLPNSSTDTYKELLELKKRISREGIFRYSDMFAFAESFLEKFAFLYEAIQYRFPFVFIDEMQDTDSVQDALLSKMFINNCTVQRFGDVNQAIFFGNNDVKSQNTFPVETVVDLPQSKRFNNLIADFASSFTVEFKQVLRGNEERATKTNTIFLFDDDTIHTVFPEYANLINTQYSEGLPMGFSAIAVGARKKEADKEETAKKNMLYNISAYWNGFLPNHTSKSLKENRFIDLVYHARERIKETSECRESFGLLFDGIVEIYRTIGVTYSDGSKLSQSKFKAMLQEMPIFGEKALNNILRSFLFLHDIYNKDVWAQNTAIFFNIFEATNPKGIEELSNYMAWSEEINNIESGPKSAVNVFEHNGVKVKVGTIHSVKGETHHASLVLETYERIFDVKQIDLPPYLLPVRKLGFSPSWS